MLDIGKFHIDDELDKPLYRRIYRWIEKEIKSGSLESGHKLQPVRMLANQLGVNRGAVAHAYNELIRDGLLHGSPGRGTFAGAGGEMNLGNSTINEEETFWQPILTEMNSRLGPSRQTSSLIDQDLEWVPEYGSPSDFQAKFAMDLPLSDHNLSYSIIKNSLERVSKSLPSDALAYGHPQGLPSLRTKLAILAQQNGFSTKSNDILVCNGTQQALSLVSSLLIQPGDAVVMANPGYAGASRVFRMYGAKILTVPADDYGLSGGQLQDLIQNHRPKLMYVVSTFHAPTGITLSFKRRQELYQIAEMHGIPILEDEYVNSLYYDQRPPMPIKSIDRRGIVIYAGTFSKTLGAGLRLGWISANPALISRLIQAKEAQDIHTSMITQLLMDDLLENDVYGKHLEVLRQHYKIRYHALIRALDKYFGQGIKFNRPGGGFSVWISLSGRVSTSRWLHLARIRGVNFHNGMSYFVDNAQDKYAQLCFSHIEPDHVPFAVEQLFLAYQDAQISYSNKKPTTGWFKPFS